MIAEIADAVTTIVVFGGFGLMSRGYLRYRSRRPRLCSCGHGSGPHGMDGCVMKVDWVNAAAAVNAILKDGMPDRVCGCPAYDGQGALVR